MDKIRKLIDEALEGKGMKQADLARRLHISSQAINNWKRRNSIPVREVPRVAAMLGLSPHDLWRHPNDPPDDPTPPPMVSASVAPSSNARGTRLEPMDWENEGELDRQTYLLAPLLDVEFSAGEGATVEEEREQYRLPIRRYTLHKQGISASDVRLVRVMGDSMEDKISDDSVVAINTADTKPRDGKIYAYTDEDLLKVKYLHPLPGGGLRIRSHNPDYPDEVLSPDEVRDRIRIHGRVFMYSSLC